ncbi:MAG: hypothetical protein NWR52_04315, partial [Paracoccaceae bacterium]|nr:hypothetical protein [Paracoccaceae bacterium]
PPPRPPAGSARTSALRRGLTHMGAQAMPYGCAHAARARVCAWSRQAAVQDLPAMTISETDIADLVAFLNALTGETALTRPLGRPDHVPSGLPVD